MSLKAKSEVFNSGLDTNHLWFKKRIILRRLNFLLPNALLAKKVVTKLNELGIRDKNIHTYVKDNALVEVHGP